VAYLRKSFQDLRFEVEGEAAVEVEVEAAVEVEVEAAVEGEAAVEVAVEGEVAVAVEVAVERPAVRADTVWGPSTCGPTRFWDRTLPVMVG
jgi:hypothetical protein